jgi:hypothetical protein
MRPQADWGAQPSAPTGNTVSLSSLVTGALNDGYHHLLLEMHAQRFNPLEVSHAVRAAFLPNFDVVLLTPEELDAHWAFLTYSGLTRALVEVTALEDDVLELRVLEW